MEELGLLEKELLAKAPMRFALVFFMHWYSYNLSLKYIEYSSVIDTLSSYDQAILLSDWERSIDRLSINDPLMVDCPGSEFHGIVMYFAGATNISKEGEVKYYVMSRPGNWSEYSTFFPRKNLRKVNQ